MKKILSIALILCLCVGLVCTFVACGKDTTPTDDTQTKLAARKLASVSDLWADLTGLDFPQASLFVKKSLIESEPQTVRALSQVVQASIAYLNESSEHALELGNFMQSQEGCSLKGAVVSKCYLDMRQQYKAAQETKDDVTRLVNVLMPAMADKNYTDVFYADDGSTSAETGNATLNVMTPDGAPAMALAYMMKNTATLNGHAMQYSIINGTQVAASMTNGDADVIIAPTNAGVAKAFQTKNYQLVAVTSWGNLYILSTDPSLKTLAECNGAAAFLQQFAGKSISSIGNNQVPDLTLNHLLTLANVSVTVADGVDAQTIQTDLLRGRITNALLGEPAVTGTIALIQSKQ